MKKAEPGKKQQATEAIGLIRVGQLVKTVRFLCDENTVILEETPPDFLRVAVERAKVWIVGLWGKV